jgi:mannose-6-phosphate isomerase-like protein (cupin superfamily)
MDVDAAPKAQVSPMDNAPKAQYFSLKEPLLSSGKTQRRFAKGDLLNLAIKVYAEGGENGLHTHKDEEHSFVVLQGQGVFYDETGAETVLKKNEGILLPRGAFYRFEAIGDENLVMLRIGAGREWDRTKAPRIGTNGRPLTKEENKHVDGTVIPGKFFGA